jgi:hypothetical protein
MRGFICTAVAALVVAAATAASAAEVGGNYRVAGTGFDGTSYTGTARITATSETTCRIVWHIGDQTPSGICMRSHDIVSAGYKLGNDIGLVIYELQGDEILKGVWTLADQNGAGSEVLTPAH